MHIIRYSDEKGKYHDYITETKVLAEEVAAMRRDDKVVQAWLDGKRRIK